MSAIGILGGTFDPIHFGHLITAQSLLEKRKLKKIIFVPSFISPHKVNFDYSSPEHRLNMVKLAIESHPQFDVSDFEVKHDTVSYTYNALLEFSKKFEEIELIIGFDNLITFDTWHKAEEIIELAKLVVMTRTFDKEIKNPHKFFGEAIYVDTPTIEISSTEIRKRITKKFPIDFFLPQKVKEYIFENEIYSAAR